MVYQPQIVYHPLFPHFSHKDIVGVDLFNWSVDTVSHGVSRESEVLTNWLVGVDMTSLGGCAVVFSKPLDCLLPCLPTVLSDIWRSSVTLTARDNVKQI